MKNKMKRQPIECEKISVNCTPDKGLISKMYKKHIQLKNRKKKKNHTHTKKQIHLKNGQNTKIDIYSKEDI